MSEEYCRPRVTLEIHPRAIGEFVDRVLPVGDTRRVLIKPNWVKHQEREEFPLAALVTSTELIDEVIQGCLRKYPGLETLIVGDVPLQSCEWEQLTQQTGIDRLADRYRKYSRPRIQFLDLRQERWRSRGGFLARDAEHEGDPAGYADVIAMEEALDYIKKAARAESTWNADLTSLRRLDMRSPAG